LDEFEGYVERICSWKDRVDGWCRSKRTKRRKRTLLRRKRKKRKKTVRKTGRAVDLDRTPAMKAIRRANLKKRSQTSSQWKASYPFL
jgi:hypothetical protein